MTKTKAARGICGRRFLVVEDDYFIACDMAKELSSAGATVLGPVATIDHALSILEGETSIDGAILDVNLRGDPVYPVAEALEKRAIPYIFATGYDASAIDGRFQSVVRCEKPVTISQIAAALFG